MVTLLLHGRLFPFLSGGHRQLALENLALRQQLAVPRGPKDRSTTASSRPQPRTPWVSTGGEPSGNVGSSRRHPLAFAAGYLFRGLPSDLLAC